ncbi:MAG: type II toxin-antitoxin system RelE/ParE family toxin [Patescibacteria group bacterium]|nr:type II toxin-antitoxin system RelE/ParE family toxin [Patescibacteria group bacterium]
MYKIVLHKRAKKQLRKLPRADQIKITKTIKKLAINPLNFELNVKAYKKESKTYRVRKGNLRIIYYFNQKTHTIFIDYLGHRGNMYRLF